MESVLQAIQDIATSSGQGINERVACLLFQSNLTNTFFLLNRTATTAKQTDALRSVNQLDVTWNDL